MRSPSPDGEAMEQKHIPDWITLLVGIWLIAAPFVLGIVPPEGVPSWPLTADFMLSGMAAVVLALAATSHLRRWEEWFDIALGLWLVGSPWILGLTYSQTATWNAVVCGLLIGVMGVWGAIEANRHYSA